MIAYRLECQKNYDKLIMITVTHYVQLNQELRVNFIPRSSSVKTKVKIFHYCYRKSRLF